MATVSHHSVERTVGLMNARLDDMRDRGLRPTLIVDCLPDLEVQEFDEAKIYRRFGRGRNRAPRITGQVAITGILAETAGGPEDPVATFVTVETGNAMYGINMGREELAEVAQALGMPKPNVVEV